MFIKDLSLQMSHVFKANHKVAKAQRIKDNYFYPSPCLRDSVVLNASYLSRVAYINDSLLCL